MNIRRCGLGIVLVGGLFVAAISYVACARAAGETAWWSSAPVSAANRTAAALRCAFGEGADAAWYVAGGAAEKDGGPLLVVDDPLIQQKVMECGSVMAELNSRSSFHDVEFSFFIRFMVSRERPAGDFTMFAAKDPTNSASRGLYLGMHGAFNGDITVNCWNITYVPYDLRAYDTIMPTWPDYLRLPIERDMASLPLAQDKWVQVRWQLTKEWSRVWIDDLLAAKAVGSSSNIFNGNLSMLIHPGVRLAGFKARAMGPDELKPDTLSFETVPLTGFARGRALKDGKALSDDALPFGQTVVVNGIPLKFADRTIAGAPDHLDLSPSMLRQANMEGYISSMPNRFVSGFQVDPARIRFRVPNAQYDAMYVVAGYDGAENRIPQMTAMFFREDGGFAQCFEQTVPALTDDTAVDAKPLPVRLENGRKVNLWLVKIPLDPGILASFSDLAILDVELTKKVKLYRSYPDPVNYGWHQAGLPSGVHVYAVTLHRPDVDFKVDSIPFGHVWTDPEIPAYEVAVKSRVATSCPVEIAVATVSHDGLEKTNRPSLKLVVQPNQDWQKVRVDLPVKKNGLHSVEMTLKTGTNAPTTWKETRYFARLPKDTRAAEWTAGEGPYFGYWSYFGGHHTPKREEIARLMKLAGGRQWINPANPWALGPQWDWAGKDPVDAVGYAAYKTNAVALIRNLQGDSPDLVTFYAEPHISSRLTAGNPSDYWGEPLALTPEEKLGVRVFVNTSKAAAEGVRAAWPNKKILIPWGDPLFVLPILRAGFPTNLIDGSGLDMVGFERLPEQQIAQMSTHRLYFLKEEYRKAGITNPLLCYIEGTFAPTEPGALTWEEQAERYHRWTLLSLAYGVDRFYSGWFAFDCCNYYGAEHYGGCGIQRRIPYSDPKPAYVHYATMTRMLERSKFEKWLPTGSLSAYCLKFNKPVVGPIYVLWTIRGKRSVDLTLEKDVKLTATDSMDNGTDIQSSNLVARIEIDQSPVYVTGAGEVKGIKLGDPDYSGDMEWARTREQQTWHTGPVVHQPPVTKEIVVADLGDGSWRLTNERDGHYESNNFDMARYYGNMSVITQNDFDRKGESFLAVHLEKPEKDRKFMPYYRILKSQKTVVIPGKAVALGVWVKAASDWGRIVWRLKDAKGEVWTSVGTKDEWNCNDGHGWSSFNFDGWRYVRFELPAHSEWDVFREVGTTWWGSRQGDGIVDLPLTLDAIIVERRTHAMYVNDLQENTDKDVLLGKMVAEYATEFDASQQAVALNRLRMPIPHDASQLINPIERMTRENKLAPVKITGIKVPDWGYDGTRCHVQFTEQAGGVNYQVWVAAYPDGRGAVALASMPKSGGLVNYLRPARKFYLWVTYDIAAAGDKPLQTSKPSNRFEIELVDAFGMK